MDSKDDAFLNEPLGSHIDPKEAALRASAVFEKEGWTWGWGNTAYIPSPDRIEKTIIELISGLGSGPGDYCETGRLIALNHVDEDGIRDIKICLILGSEY